jgi:predicted acylesterase/phospholipase RssA
MLLVDGGITNRLPVKCAVLSGAQSITAVDLALPPSPEKEMNSVVNLHLRTDELLAFRFDLYNNAMADLVLKPELEDMRWYEFKKYSHAIEKGRKMVKDSLPRIKRVMSRSYRYKKSIGRFLGRDSIPPAVLPSEYIML